jgi:hypothetical protein
MRHCPGYPNRVRVLLKPDADPSAFAEVRVHLDPTALALRCLQALRGVLQNIARLR